MATGERIKRYSKPNARLRLLSDRRYEAFANFRNILIEWTKTLPNLSPKSAQLVDEKHDDEKSDRQRDTPPRVAPYEAFQNVVHQKEAILDRLRKRKFQQAESFVDDLVRGQLANSGFDLVAKSLCDLAKGAKELGFLAYQLAWSSRAREINPEDPWVHNHFADALLGQGDFQQALDVYEATTQRVPENVVARHGKAEVLKALGRLPEALEAYEATILRFPENFVARTGKATLLVLLGRYQEAAALVRVDRVQTREEWIGLHIRASIQMKQGRFDEADKLFSAGTQCPWTEVRSRFIGARALLRIRMKKLKEADAMIRSEHSLVSKMIQIDIYRRMNRIGEARSVLRELRECPVAEIVEISRGLERNMKPGKRTVSDDEFLDRELALVMAA